MGFVLLLACWLKPLCIDCRCIFSADAHRVPWDLWKYHGNIKRSSTMVVGANLVVIDAIYLELGIFFLAGKWIAESATVAGILLILHAPVAVQNK